VKRVLQGALIAQPEEDARVRRLGCADSRLFLRFYKPEPQLMIVIRAGTNALLRRRYVWGESCSVAAIPAGELSMISKCANPSIRLCM